MGEQVLREVDQHMVVAHGDDRLMEGDIDLGIFVELGVQLAILEGCEHLPQGGDLVVARVERDQPGGHALQRRPGGDQLDHLLLGLAHHIDPAPRHRADETFALELGHRLAHRRAADPEIGRELALVEPHLAALVIDIE
jgi:hypothetical protein